MRRTRFTNRRQGSRGWYATLSASLALVCVLAQLSSAAHLVLVHHERCPEHGEWIHAHDHQAELDAGSTQGAPGLEATVAQGALEDDHGHCFALSERRDASLSSSNADELPGLTIDTDAGRGQGSQHVASSVYAFAPKTSPPEIA